jgi:hypothetical protein
MISVLMALAGQVASVYEEYIEADRGQRGRLVCRCCKTGVPPFQAVTLPPCAVGRPGTDRVGGCPARLVPNAVTGVTECGGHGR